VCVVKLLLFSIFVNLLVLRFSLCSSRIAFYKRFQPLEVQLLGKILREDLVTTNTG